MLYGAVFQKCTSLTSVSIPENVNTIGDACFKDCTSLTSVSIPDSVTLIGDRAFSGCDAITVIVSSGSEAEQYCKDNGINYTYVDASN